MGEDRVTYHISTESSFSICALAYRVELCICQCTHVSDSRFFIYNYNLRMSKSSVLMHKVKYHVQHLNPFLGQINLTAYSMGG